MSECVLQKGSPLALKLPVWLKRLKSLLSVKHVLYNALYYSEHTHRNQYHNINFLLASVTTLSDRTEEQRGHDEPSNTDQEKPVITQGHAALAEKEKLQ